MGKTGIKDAISKLAYDAIDQRLFPGCVIGVVTREGENIIRPFGQFTYDANAKRVREDTIYDVASITKSIPTSCLALYLIEQKKMSLGDPLIFYIPEYKGAFREEITILHLLTQTLQFSFPLSSIAHLKPDEMIEKIVHANLLRYPGSTYYYANATSILLGMVIEKVTGKSLDSAAQEVFFTPLGMTQTTFHPSSNTPPTEVSSSGKDVKGIVHDESARALLPRTVGSAGLFTSVPDLLRFLQMLLTGGSLDGRYYFSEETVKSMYVNHFPNFSVSVGLGWELSASFMGDKPGKTTFGKTGFTGCMAVCDRTKGLGIVMLSNRTYPHRPPSGDAIHQVRRSFCEAVFSTG